LGGLPVTVKDGKAVLRDSGNLAGSCLTMDRALKQAVAFTSLSLAEVLPALTINPARQIGVDDRKGSIEVGKDADLVALGPDLTVVRTYVKGVRVDG
jgi:N-acetylglucosamine-6-phosphate deacetylase